LSPGAYAIPSRPVRSSVPTEGRNTLVTHGKGGIPSLNQDGPAAAVGYSGSGFLHVGLDGREARYDAGSAWYENGEPLVSPDALKTMQSAIQTAVEEGCREADCVVEAVESEAGSMLRSGQIPVQDVQGPVLLHTGSSDRLWFSTGYTTFAVRRLRNRGHEYPYEHRAYSDAGHVFYLPYVDYSGRLTSSEYGGTPTANYDAGADAWPITLAYLRSGLRE
jgi:hypothetical protein